MYILHSYYIHLSIFRVPNPISQFPMSINLLSPKNCCASETPGTRWWTSMKRSPTRCHWWPPARLTAWRVARPRRFLSHFFTVDLFVLASSCLILPHFASQVPLYCGCFIINYLMFFDFPWHHVASILEVLTPSGVFHRYGWQPKILATQSSSPVNMFDHVSMVHGQLIDALVQSTSLSRFMATLPDGYLSSVHRQWYSSIGLAF